MSSLFLSINLLSPFLSGSQTRNLRSFDQLPLSFGAIDDISTTSVGYSEELVINNVLQLSVGFDTRLNHRSLSMLNLPLISDYGASAIFSNKANNFFASLPLKASIRTQSSSFGGFFDLVLLTFGARYEIETLSNEGLLLSTQVFSSVFSSKEKIKNLSNQLFLAYIFDQLVSIQLGLRSQFVNYNLRLID